MQVWHVKRSTDLLTDPIRTYLVKHFLQKFLKGVCFLLLHEKHYWGFYVRQLKWKLCLQRVMQFDSSLKHFWHLNVLLKLLSFFY